MADFLSRLEPLATSSAYAASSLPQLMLEAGQLDRLVTLTLGGGALPQANAVTKRDIELQRLQFALRASIRARRFTDAAKLALKAGGEAAANSRQRTPGGSRISTGWQSPLATTSPLSWR